MLAPIRQFLYDRHEPKGKRLTKGFGETGGSTAGRGRASTVLRLCLVMSHQTPYDSVRQGKSMSPSLSRRQFIIALGAAGGASFIPHNGIAGLGEPPLYPPVDLSYFDRPLTPAPFEVHFG